MREYRVLITSIGSTTSIGVIKFIRKCNQYQFFLVGTDINEENRIAGSSFVDKFYKIGSFDDAGYLDSLKDIVIKNKIDILIPIHDSEVASLSKAVVDFREIGCNIVVSQDLTIELVNNKYLFAKKLAERNIVTPGTWLLKEWNRPFNNEAKYILKPVTGVSSRGIFIGDSAEIRQLVEVKKLDPEAYIVQDWINGQEFTVDSYVKEKKAYCIVPRTRDEVRDGLCYKASTVTNMEFVMPVTEIVSTFNFRGPINIQFIKEKHTGQLFCIECNPRFGGTSVLTLNAGINLFDYIIKDLDNQPLDVQNDYKLLFMNRYWEEIYYEK